MPATIVPPIVVSEAPFILANQQSIAPLCSTVSLVRPTVTASPITLETSPGNPHELMVQLRERALQSRLPIASTSFQSAVTGILQGLYPGSALAPGGQTQTLPVTTHQTPNTLTGLEPPFQSMLPLANGLPGEANKILTFRVPASAGPLNLRAYYYDRQPTPPSEGWTLEASFDPRTTRQQRFHNVMEVGFERVGNEIEYRVMLTHGFVGGLHLEIDGRSATILSHQTQRARPPVTTNVPVPLVLASQEDPAPVPAPVMITPREQPLPQNVIVPPPIGGSGQAVTAAELLDEGPPPVLPETEEYDPSGPILLERDTPTVGFVGGVFESEAYPVVEVLPVDCQAPLATSMPAEAGVREPQPMGAFFAFSAVPTRAESRRTAQRSSERLLLEQSLLVIRRRHESPFSPGETELRALEIA